MGVKKFFQTFRGGVEVGNVFAPNSPMAGKVVALDMMLFLCKSVKAVGGALMTDEAGVPTAGLNTMLTILPKFKAAGVARLIAIFDNPRPNPMKSGEHKKRQAREATGPKVDSVVVADAQRFLTLMGVEWHVAPFGREAEQYAADLAKAGLVDIVFSDDSDTLMFGAPLVMMARPLCGKSAGKQKYTLWSLRALLAAHELTMAEFQHICVALGTDFAEKMPGVGPITALTKGKNKPLNDEQKAALAYVASPPPEGEVPALVSRTEPALDALLQWLTAEKGFNAERTRKKLKLPEPV